MIYVSNILLQICLPDRYLFAAGVKPFECFIIIKIVDVLKLLVIRVTFKLVSGVGHVWIWFSLMIHFFHFIIEFRSLAEEHLMAGRFSYAIHESFVDVPLVHIMFEALCVRI